VIWVAHDKRDNVVDFVNCWTEKTGIKITQLVVWVGISLSKFNEWKNRYGKVNEHNAWISRDTWLEEREKKSILEYYKQHQDEGYRRLAFMMLDDDVVAVSPSSVYRVLVNVGVMRKWDRKLSKKGTGFVQPLRPHDHWHIDVSYINICGTFYYLCAVLDGCSRYIVNWEIRESMKEAEIEIILERAKEKYPDVKPRIISDNGPQFIARDFKEYIRISGMTHVRTSPFYPQSNGKIERWHKTIKQESIRAHCPLNLQDARRIVEEFVVYYNTIRLHSAIGYIAPQDKLMGLEKKIFAERDRKLNEARQWRAEKRKNGSAGKNSID
jgi:transposase InsO family protein